MENVRFSQTFGKFKFNTENSTHIHTCVLDEIDGIAVRLKSIYRGEFGYFLAENNRGHKQIVPMSKAQAYAELKCWLGEYSANAMIDLSEEIL